MVQIHKYVDQGISAAVVVGLQCLFAPTRGIPYYAIGAGISYFTIQPLADFATDKVKQLSSNSLWRIFAINIIKLTAPPAARLYFADYMLGQSIGGIMGSLGYGDNFTRVLTHSTVALASYVQYPKSYNEKNRIDLVKSQLFFLLNGALSAFAHHYFEHRTENLSKIFLCILLSNLVASYAHNHLHERHPAGADHSIGFLSSFGSCIASAGIKVWGIKIVTSTNLESASVSGQVAAALFTSNIFPIIIELVVPIVKLVSGRGSPAHTTQEVGGDQTIDRGC